MRYESAKTARGNIGVSYESQAAADAQATAMDKNNCSYCSGCSDCSYCSGCMRWSGPAAKNLLSINGLEWSVAISNTHMQIGCENHSHGEWAKFRDSRIKLMDVGALAFWKQHKAVLLGLCEMRAKGESE